MEAQRTKVHLVHAALIELGMPPVYSEDENTQFGSIVDVQFPRCIARCFGLHDWSFCRRTSKLTRAAAAPETGYTYQFSMPGDKIGPPLRVSEDAKCANPLRDFRLEGNMLHCDSPQIYGRFKVKLDPRDWDDQFADAFCVALGSMLADPVLQDSNLAETLKMRAFGGNQEGLTGGLFGRLIAQHRAGEPLGDGLYNQDPLTTAHGGGSWY